MRQASKLLCVRWKSKYLPHWVTTGSAGSRGGVKTQGQALRMVPGGPLPRRSERMGFHISVFYDLGLRLRLQWRTRRGTRCTLSLHAAWPGLGLGLESTKRYLTLCSAAPALQRVQARMHSPSKHFCWMTRVPRVAAVSSLETMVGKRSCQSPW